MTDTRLYLKPNVQVEPLVDQWYAWTHLIPPATAARNITGRHLKIMDSYVNAPQIHANAVKNPAMRGGPFIDYDGKRVGEIRALRDRTKAQLAPLIALSGALAELDDLLCAKAKGHSLQPLYPEVPDILRGYVELVYDLRNHPSFRLIEPLLYASPFYDTSAQAIALSTITGDDRPFVLSTPRLESNETLHLPWSFDDERIDTLFRLKSTPGSWRSIRDLLGLGDTEAARFPEFLTETPPQQYDRYTGNGVRWRYFGHACILIETANVSILLDPVLSYTYEAEISRYTYADLPEHIDYVLITHNHQDHVLFETLLQLRHKVGRVVVPRNGLGCLQDPSLRLTLENSGFARVMELGELDRIEFEGGSITGLPFFGEHSDLAIGTKLAYLLRLGGQSLLFAADSCNVEPRLYRHLHREAGDIDVIFLGMECDGAPLSWLYGPLLTQPMERGMDQSRRLSGSDYEQARALVEEFRCQQIYVYAMGQEPWLNYVMSIKYTEQSRPIVESNRLIEDFRSRGMLAERLFGEKEILMGAAYERAF
ncbi:MAG TPA: MBL fold metallo-hydrolase [Bryobacteraceae bacterium]|jgi:L-ascorbate metabolism protein UlaG (beta-lactamase superfamily)|nr:MBL fold metallo-hydrolase [Bryobacteraceae bacterium]